MFRLIEIVLHYTYQKQRYLPINDSPVHETDQNVNLPLEELLHPSRALIFNPLYGNPSTYFWST